jgi:nitronate monooxygenase
MSEAGSLLARLRITHPIIQAPMAGGGTTPAMVAAVSEAGGLGTAAGAYLSAAQLTAILREVRERTRQPFAVNLFAPLATPAAPDDPARALAPITRYHAELGLAAPTLPAPVPADFAELFPVVLESGAAAFSFTFGIPPAGALAAARERGMLLMGTATTVAEAIALEGAGVDVVVAQGSEAGAHRGTFVQSFEASMVGTIALVPQVADAVRLPVVASGGIMDGRGIAAALALGAEAVQMGTAFLTTDEAGIPEVYKQAIPAAQAEATRVTRVFSGRPARGIVNRFMTEMEQLPDGTILPFPLQNSLTRGLRGAAAKAGQADFLSLWAGQGAPLARRQSAGALVARLVKETDAAMAALARRRPTVS